MSSFKSMMAESLRLKPLLGMAEWVDEIKLHLL